jgi:type IV secretion system protein VirB8
MAGKKKKADNMLEEAKNWYLDRYQTVVVQRNVLAIITILSLVGLGVTTFAVARIADSKTFEPYVIEVEETSGITTLVERNSVEKYTQNDAVRRYFIWSYVRAREGYDVNNYAYNFNTVVRSFSHPKVYRGFREYVAIENPGSPVHYGREKTLHPELKSLAFIGPNKAQVRVKILERSAMQKVARIKHRIITMDFTFQPSIAKNSALRYVNPLGFQVTSYRIDEDTA